MLLKFLNNAIGALIVLVVLQTSGSVASPENVIFRCEDSLNHGSIKKAALYELSPEGKQYELQPDNYDKNGGKFVSIWEQHAELPMRLRFICTYDNMAETTFEAPASVAMRCTADIATDNRGKVLKFTSAKCSVNKNK